MWILDKLRIFKDDKIATYLKSYAKEYISEYGVIGEIKLDSKNKNLRLTVLLEGESSSIDVAIDNYEVVIEKDKSYLAFDKIITSRKWINQLIENYLTTFLPEKKIEIPFDYAKKLKWLI